MSALIEGGIMSFSCQRRGGYLFFRMIMPRIMLAINDPCKDTREQVNHRRSVMMRNIQQWRRKAFSPIWRSCAAAWRCWSWEHSCWSRWQWRTSLPWSHSCWVKKIEKKETWSSESVVVVPPSQILEFIYIISRSQNQDPSNIFVQFFYIHLFGPWYFLSGKPCFF